MDNATTRVVIAESSPLSLKILERILEGAPSIEIVGVARAGREALRLVEEKRPHVLCSATRLPELSGLDLTREIMARAPLPILAMSERVLPGLEKAEDAQAAFAMLEAGAVDVWVRPRAIGLAGDLESAELIAKIKRLSRVPVISRPLRNRPPAPEDPLHPIAAKRPALLPDATERTGVRVVLIGASTGGPQAILSVISSLPRDFPVPILCVQHISKGFLDELVTWLDRQCALTVEIAREGERALPGHIYFPHEDTHLEIDARGRLHLSNAPQRDGHRPSATVTFEAGAHAYGAQAVAILLTGMGGDGAMGLRAVRSAGGATIAQNEASCVVFGMPRVAIELGAAQFIMAPAEIARKLVTLVA